MDEYQFLFVTCVNDENLYNICTSFIKNLIIPEKYTVDLFPVRSTKSMAEGYNLALKHKAKYKIYLHQDTFIYNQNFLHEILYLFKANPSLGLLGMVGCIGRPESGDWGKGQTIGKMVVYLNHDKKYHNYSYLEVPAPFAKVDLLDGYIMITQYDIPWRADLFDGFHLYDSSQCVEFAQQGYLVGIPHQVTPWTCHFINHEINNEEWKKYQEIFKKTYHQTTTV